MAREMEKPPSCLYCFNVRIGALFKAFMVLFGGFLLSSLAILYKCGWMDIRYIQNGDTTTAYLNYYVSSDKQFFIQFLCGLFYMLIGLMALSGIVKRRARLLMPLFIVQLFNLINTIGNIFSVALVADKSDVFINEVVMNSSYREWVMSLDPDIRFVCVMSYLFLQLNFDLIFTKCIFQTYKHITVQELSAVRSTELNVISSNKPCKIPTDMTMVQIEEHSLPTYEDIQKVPLVSDEEYQVKPPAYKEKKEEKP